MNIWGKAQIVKKLIAVLKSDFINKISSHVCIYS